MSENKENKFAIKGKVKNIKGTIIAPETGNLKFVLNVLAMTDKPDSPLFDLFDKKWKKVKEEAKGWYARRENFKLGATMTTAVQSDVWVLSLLCKDKDNALDAAGLEKALGTVAGMAVYEKAGVHVSGLLTKEVPEIVEMIDKVLIPKGVNVYYYEEV